MVSMLNSFGALRCAHAPMRPSKLHSLRNPFIVPKSRTRVSYFSSRGKLPFQIQHAPASAPAPDGPKIPSSTPSSSESRHRWMSPLHKTLEPSGGYDLAERYTETAVRLRDEYRQLRDFEKQLRILDKKIRTTEGLVKRTDGPWTVTGGRWDMVGEPNSHASLGQGFVYAGLQKVPNIWLRDNCQCSSCVHEVTRQRLLDTFSIPEDIYIRKALEYTDRIEITWSDGHESTYNKDFLAKAGASMPARADVRQGHTDGLKLWGSEIAQDPPRVDLKSMKGDNLMKNCLVQIRNKGFCYIDNVAPDPKATEELLSRIAFIRETHYGGFYDFTADLASKDTAYTNIALGAHTDTTYFSDPAGLQAFHLLSHTDGEGGASLFVDGFNAADQLLHEDPDAYHILATVNVHAHASGNEGISIQPYKGFPVLGHDLETGALLQVRWNTSDRAAIELPLGEVGKWYAAARKFDAILKRKENEYWEQLTPGRVVIFDNWRVLHGRSAFTGKRRICGGYINRDDWISKFKMLYFGQKKVLSRLASG